MKKHQLQRGRKENNYICTNITDNIVCSFELGKFNETQKFTFLNDNEKELDVMEIAKIMREFGDWLVHNHLNLL